MIQDYDNISREFGEVKWYRCLTCKKPFAVPRTDIVGDDSYFWATAATRAPRKGGKYCIPVLNHWHATRPEEY